VGTGLPIQEALSFARQIAEALEAAHEKGIVHRDLKPGNIKITPEGAVKVLDFGLAKAAANSDASPDGSIVATANDTATRTGVVMGTAAYMSPEQANGEKVDKRTDIWAFGCVLYEMLTGRAAFAKTTGAETIGAVLYRDPSWEALPSDAPIAVRVVLDRCLQKDPRERMRDIGDAQLGLTGAFLPPALPDAMRPTSLQTPGISRPLWRRAALVLVSLLIGGLVTAVAMRRHAAERPAQVAALSISTRGEAASYVGGSSQALAITPDGSRIVYVGDGGRRIFVRALNQLEPMAIAAGTLLMNPFVSPDGLWVGYGEGFGVVKKVPIAGGPAITITSGSGELLRGAVWLADNTIVFGGHDTTTGLQRVSAVAGTRQVLTTPDANRNEFDHYWPQALPDGRSLLYTVLARDLGAAKVAVYDLQTNTSTDLLTGGSYAMYLRSGHLVYVAGGALWAVPFDADRRIITGAAVLVLKQLASARTGAGNFAASATGTLVYAHTSGYDPNARTLSWIDRNGRQEPLDAIQHHYTQPRISPDGKRIVYVTRTAPDNNVWVLDVSRPAPSRLRTEAATDQNPSWSPDGQWVLFASTRDGGQAIWRHAADGTGEPEFQVDGFQPIVTRDGKQLIFASSNPGNSDIMQMALDGSRRQEPLVTTPAQEAFAEISPNGRWLAYQSNISGRDEVWVRPYPNTESGRSPVSTNGGRWPIWSRNGLELFYLAPDGALMGVQVKDAGSTWTATSPSKILEPGYWSSDVLIGRQYDVAPDGKRFLVVTPPKDAGDPPELIVKQQWEEELKALVPSK
jgi:serine/threonine-protein kinase